MSTAHMHRCPECLQVYAGTERFPVNTHCACNGVVQYLGRVNGGRILRDVEGCPPCDFRCTEATNRICSCQCRGLNHGTHHTVTVEIEERWPVVTPVDPEACIARRAELRDAIAAVWADFEQRYPGLRDRQRRGEWIGNRAEFDAIEALKTRVRGVYSLTNHANRLKRLRIDSVTA